MNYNYIPFVKGVVAGVAVSGGGRVRLVVGINLFIFFSLYSVHESRILRGEGERMRTK